MAEWGGVSPSPADYGSGERRNISSSSGIWGAANDFGAFHVTCDFMHFRAFWNLPGMGDCCTPLSANWREKDSAVSSEVRSVAKPCSHHRFWDILSVERRLCAKLTCQQCERKLASGSSTENSSRLFVSCVFVSDSTIRTIQLWAVLNTIVDS